MSLDVRHICHALMVFPVFRRQHKTKSEDPLPQKRNPCVKLVRDVPRLVRVEPDPEVSHFKPHLLCKISLLTRQKMSYDRSLNGTVTDRN